ncbi:CPBP family intramembrane glutamic endopeptidase [Pyruvatibacter sp.]|uniref:CPBP family intramembrane glutamic endopeptidase n=1 Tax=Pyruvatibacter sp. TaxID=1981328 RepID=UPI0032EBE12D
MSNATGSSNQRLQRARDFTGDRLTTFREVFVRHGLPGAALALICLAVPGLQTAFSHSLAEGMANPQLYFLALVVLFLAFNGHAWLIDRRWDASKLGWIIYLGALSFWEEWVFRLAVPNLLEGFGASVWVAATLSAVVFGAAHYFTLRWKWQWCVAAFVGSLALSRQMELHDDLLLITAIHWIATYLNTPRPPAGSVSNQNRK